MIKSWIYTPGFFSVICL